MMGAAVVAPADVVAKLFGGNVGEDIVENFDAGRQMCRGVGEVAALGTAVKRHCGVGGIKLQIETGVDDRLIFGCQRGRGGLQVQLVRLVKPVRKIERDLSRCNGRYKRVVGRSVAESGFEIVDLLVDRFGVENLHWSVQYRQAQVLSAFATKCVLSDAGSVGKVGGHEIGLTLKARHALDHII